MHRRHPRRHSGLGRDRRARDGRTGRRRQVPTAGQPRDGQGPSQGQELTAWACKKGKPGKYTFRKIQKAVNFAKRGDTVRVCKGVWKENVTITGHKKDGLKLDRQQRRAPAPLP